MKLPPQQLPSHLQQQLAPVYLVTGDEALLVQEACDAIRSKARESGCEERVVMHVETGFDWHRLQQEASDLSLFSRRRLLELRLPSGKPGDAGSKALQAYAKDQASDDVLLVMARKIEAAARNSRWYKALDSRGVVVQIWPLAARQLPAWLNQRMRQRGMTAGPDALALLADRVEGNLLAAAQEIDKLHMWHGPGTVTADELMEAVADSARYDVFGLVDSALAGDAARILRMLVGLRTEGVEPTVVLWALLRELRSLAAMAATVRQGSTPAQALARHHVWDKRKALVGGALQRRDDSGWLGLLQEGARIDRMIKGLEAGNPWDELLQLCLQMAGRARLSVAS